MSRCPSPRQRGLTLVEVVVALAVLSLVVLALGASLRGIAQSAARVDQRTEAIDEMRVGIAFLREVFERSLLVRATGPERRLLFEAQPDAVAWVAVMPARFGAAGRFAFRLALEDGADGSRQLVLRYAPWTASSVTWVDWAQAEHRVLAQQVEQLNFGYGGEGLAEGWLPTWTDNERLPPRLRLDLATAQGAWPPVVLAVRTPPRPGGRFVIGGSPR